MHYRIKLSTTYLIMGLISLLCFTGCASEKQENQAISLNPDALKTEAIEMIYGLSPGALSKAESEDVYEFLTEGLTVDQQALLQKHLNSYVADKYQHNAGQPSLRSSTETELSSGTIGDLFGTSIDREDDYLFVGAPGSNKVYVYIKDSLHQTLSPSSGAVSFGTFVCATGRWIAAAAPATGEIVLFEMQPDGFYSEQGSVTTTLSMIGTGAGMEMDANMLALMGTDGTFTSQIEIYEYSGGSWAYTENLESSPDYFFWEMDMQGNRIAATAIGPPPTGIFSPEVIIWRNTGAGWNLQDRFAMPAGSFVARSIALDNGTIISNCVAPDSISYVYKAKPSGWALNGQIENESPTFVQTRKVELNGNNAVIGFATGGFLPEAGDRVEVYKRSGSVWSMTHTITPSDGGLNQLFGEAVIIQGGRVHVGSPGEFSTTAPGSVYVY